MDFSNQGLSGERLVLQSDHRQGLFNISLPQRGAISRNISNFNKSGHWTQKQNAKYFAFLLKFSQKFSLKQSRRQWKVFKALSKFIKTRNANQCRSHHHKMSKNFSSIQETLQFLSKKHPNIKQRSQKYAEQLQKIDIGAQQATFPDTMGRIYPQGVDRQTYPVYSDQPLKVTDPSKLATQATYNYPQPAQYQMPAYSNQVLPSYLPYPSTVNMSMNMGYQPSYQAQPSSFSQYGYPYLGYSSQSQVDYMNNMRKREREERWTECHALFAQWISKVQALINDQ